MSLDGGLTPAKLCKRIGRSQAWVRSRMAVTILPARWRDRARHRRPVPRRGRSGGVGRGPRTGPPRRGVRTPRRSRLGRPGPHRRRLPRRPAPRRRLRAGRRARPAAKHAVVFTNDDPAPDKAKRLGELFDPDGCKAHTGEPCHAVVVRSTTWGEGVDRYEVCTDPRRHAPSRVGTANGSDIATDRTPTRSTGSGDDSHAKRKARLARLAHATETFARPRGGFSQTDLTRLALHGLIHEAGRDALALRGDHARPRPAPRDHHRAAARRRGHPRRAGPSRRGGRARAGRERHVLVGGQPAVPRLPRAARPAAAGHPTTGPRRSSTATPPATPSPPSSPPPTTPTTATTRPTTTTTSDDDDLDG